MLLITGEFECSLDDKFRLALPVKLREQIDPAVVGSRFYMMLGPNRVISLYPEKIYERMVLVVAPGMAAPDEALAIDRVNYSMASKVDLDRQNRVLVSEKMRVRSGINQHVTLIGVRDHIEIWDQAVWAQYLQSHIDSQADVMLKARQDVFRQERESAENAFVPLTKEQ